MKDASLLAPFGRFALAIPRWALLALAVGIILMPLTGCVGTLVKKGDFTNRLVMTVACDEMEVNSRWFGMFSFGTPVDQKDAQPILDTRCGGPAAKPAAAAASAAK